jgi:hypothetical protein
LHERIFIAALGSTILLGAALFWVLRAERRKALLEPRLRRSQNRDLAETRLSFPYADRAWVAKRCPQCCWRGSMSRLQRLGIGSGWLTSSRLEASRRR